MSDKKTIFITIEIKSREFISKCLLAHELVKRGFRVYIGTFDTIDRAVVKVPSSIFFHKSTHIYKSEFYKSIGSLFVFLDEEGGITIPRSKLVDFCNKRYSLVNKEKNDLVFLPSKKYENIVLKLPNIKDVDCYTTGWPRIDLWKDKFSGIYQAETNNILKKYGNYYLLITSFGMTSEKTFKNRIKSSTTEFEIAYRTHKYDAFLDYVELIKKLSKFMKKDEQIIIRPHPSEDISDWKKIIKNLNNIKVVRDGDITPWLHGADALIQYGSTTAVQAAINGIPSIQYKIKKEIGITDTPVFELSYDADTPEEVYILLNKYKHLKDENIKRKVKELLKNDMSYDENELASVKIANKLSTLDIKKVKKVKLSLKDKLDPWFYLLSNKRTLLKRKFNKESTLKRIQIEKVPNGIRKSEVEKLINKFSIIEKNKDLNIQIEQVCKNLVSLEFNLKAE